MDVAGDLVAQRGDLVGDPHVGVVQGLEVVGAGGEIVEAVRVEQHGHVVGSVALVDRDQPLVELLDGDRRTARGAARVGARPHRAAGASSCERASAVWTWAFSSIACAPAWWACAVSEAICAVCASTRSESWPASERAASILSFSDGSLAPARLMPNAAVAATATIAPSAMRRRRNARRGRTRALRAYVVAASISFGACGVS